MNIKQVPKFGTINSSQIHIIISTVLFRYLSFCRSRCRPFCQQRNEPIFASCPMHPRFSVTGHSTATPSFRRWNSEEYRRPSKIFYIVVAPPRRPRPEQVPQ